MTKNVNHPIVEIVLRLFRARAQDCKNGLKSKPCAVRDLPLWCNVSRTYLIGVKPGLASKSKGWLGKRAALLWLIRTGGISKAWWRTRHTPYIQRKALLQLNTLPG